MTFQSILFPCAEQRLYECITMPDCFPDLLLDQVVAAITAGKEAYHLKPLFYTPVAEPETIAYRQEVMRDLEDATVFAIVSAFAGQMREMHRLLNLAERMYYRYQRERWFLEAVTRYCEAVSTFLQELTAVTLRSRGLQAFRDYLRSYCTAARFTGLQRATRALQEALAGVHYCLRIREASVTVRRYEGEPDYSQEIGATFARFHQQGAEKDSRLKVSERQEMNHIEAQILELVARLYPEIFGELDTFYQEQQDYYDETLATFEREIQFYLSYLEHIAGLRRRGLSFCYPQITTSDKEIFAQETFDLALAGKLAREAREPAVPVCNDFKLEGRERIIVVTGPNQGGKTTFARTCGQLHYLAVLGCPVPGRAARLFLADRLLTHFEREEQIKNLRGKLEDDLVRLHAILTQATPQSIIILNEIFTSTTLHDALFLSRKIMEQLIARDVLAVWVTFLDELASYSEQTVSMVASVAAEDPAVRTYRIVRKPADGLAYALAIAAKHRVTYSALKERLPA
jgi:DNA mismatch repair protein MutS